MTKTPIEETHQRWASHLRELRMYPLARIGKAFDAVVSACGYNSYHEWLSMAVPTVWVPNESTKLDDQIARARFAADRGLGLAAQEGEATSVSEAVDLIVRDEVRHSLVSTMSCLPRSDGADQAARAIVQLLDRGAVQ